MRSSSRIVIAVAFVLLFSECRKKVVLCEIDIYEIPAEVAFKGFEESDLDTILVRRYTAGSNFTDLTRSDTVVSSTPLHIGDTTYRSMNLRRIGFVQVFGHHEYEVVIPDLSLTYRISNLHYSGDSVIRWITEGVCKGSAFEKTADTVSVDNVNVPLSSSDHFNIMFVYLVK